MTGNNKPFYEPGDVAVRHHHPLRHIRQRHAVRRLVELSHQVKTRQGDVEARHQEGDDELVPGQGEAEQADADHRG